MKLVRDVVAVAGSLMGGCIWVFYVVGHCTSGKSAVLQATPTIAGFALLSGLAMLITVAFTRHWSVIALVGSIPILLFDLLIAKDTLQYGLPQKPMLVWLTLAAPILLIVGAGFVGGRLRKWLLPAHRS